MNIVSAAILSGIIIAATSCTRQTLDEPPLQYSFIPKKIDFDSIASYVKVSPEPRLVMPDFPDTSKFRYFESVPVLLKQLSLPDSILRRIESGILISPRDAMFFDYYRKKSSAAEAYMTYYKTANEANMVRIENVRYLLDTYYDQAKAAEVLYQNEIVRLRKVAVRSWFEKNMSYFGFAAGIAVALLTEWAVVSVAK